MAKKIWVPIIKRRGESVLMASFLMMAYQDQYHQEIMLMPRGVHQHKYLDGQVIAEANDVGEFERCMTKRISPEYLKFFILKCRNESDRLLKTAREIRSKTYKEINNAELLSVFATYTSDVIRVMPFLFGLVILERVLQKELETKLAEHCQKNNIEADVEAHLSSLIFPQEKNIPSLAIIDLYKLAINQHDSDFESKLNAYLEKYDFLNMEYYVGRPLTREELLNNIKDVATDAENRLARIEKESKKTDEDFERICNKLKLTSELRSFIDSMKAIHYLRQHRADALFKAGRDVLVLMNEIAERLDINYDALISMTWQEISESLITGKLTLAKDIIEARQSGYGILLIDGEHSFITGDALTKELKALSTGEEKVKELCGRTAFRGIYRGRVVIVTTPNELEKVKKGDILVSPMTDPYYTPALIKAGAVVTDEGGVLSHAAIVAREMGIPCIVGTGKATKVLRDGDWIVVDASQHTGSIRIVKRSAII